VKQFVSGSNEDKYGGEKNGMRGRFTKENRLGTRGEKPGGDWKELVLKHSKKKRMSQ